MSKPHDGDYDRYGSTRWSKREERVMEFATPDEYHEYESDDEDDSNES